MRFDEVELEAVPLGEPLGEPLDLPQAGTESSEHAPRTRRLLALLIDLSLFVALSMALSPLLPTSMHWTTLASLAGFVVVLSYYYFVGTWMLWGKTVGGAIFDVRVVSRGGNALTLRAATMRWLGVYLSLVSAGLGFALAALPSRQSLPDRMSASRCVAA